MFVSYAQHFEDARLFFALSGVKEGFYIDIGANDPTGDSVTRAFYERGWRGINVEPLPEIAEKLRTERPEDITIQAAISDANGSCRFYEMEISGLSTMREDVAQNWRKQGYQIKREIIVPVLRLSEILSKAQGKDIHFLKIDVEGMEEKILNACDFSREPRPWVIVIEQFDQAIGSDGRPTWERGLHAAGYSAVCADGTNVFYASQEHPDIVEALRRPIPISRVLRARERDLANELAHIEGQLAGTKAKLASTESQLAETKVKLASTESQLAETKVKLASTESQLLLIHSSRSWRLLQGLKGLEYSMRHFLRG